VKVLIACEFSGIVRESFVKKGHNTMSCDILSSEIEGNHYCGNVLDVLNEGWDLMIAHPPCTYLSNAGARFLYPKGKLNKDRLELGMDAKRFFMKLYKSNIPRSCIENPIPSRIFGLPKYNQIIQPYEYGHRLQKRTCLWLKNLPRLTPTKILDKPQSTKVPGNWFNKGGKNRQKNRARTFQGIATAMAEQWG